MDEDLIQAQLNIKQKAQEKSIRKKDVRARREKLGFSEHQLDEDDAVIDLIEYNQMRKDNRIKETALP